MLCERQTLGLCPKHGFHGGYEDHEKQAEDLLKNLLPSASPLPSPSPSASPGPVEPWLQWDNPIFRDFDPERLASPFSGAGERFFLGSGQSQVFCCSLPFSSLRFYPALLRPSSAFYAHCTPPHSTTRPNTAWTTCSSPQTGTGKHCSAGCVQLAQEQGLQRSNKA
eukprot:scaffold96089_cov65-Phaeocystis_antarctica.AAC.2